MAEKQKKPIFKRWWFWVIVVIVIFAIGSSGGDDGKEEVANNNLSSQPENNIEEESDIEEPEPEPEPELEKLTEEEIAILEKPYAELTEEDLTILETVYSKSFNLTDEDYKIYSDNKTRLDAEKEEAEWGKHVEENTKELIAGEHIVGEHIAPGRYDIEFKGSGNFFIHSENEELLTNEVSGSMGIDKYRAILIDNAVINLKGMKAMFTPVKADLIPYKEFEIYSGYWIVGQDISEGRYKVSLASGSGNFIVHSKSGRLKTNEILGSSFGVDEVVVNLEDGDIIDLRGIKKVIFAPES